MFKHGDKHLLESPGTGFFKFPGPGKSWKTSLLLENPGI